MAWRTILITISLEGSWIGSLRIELRTDSIFNRLIALSLRVWQRYSSFKSVLGPEIEVLARLLNRNNSYIQGNVMYIKSYFFPLPPPESKEYLLGEKVHMTLVAWLLCFASHLPKAKVPIDRICWMPLHCYSYYFVIMIVKSFNVCENKSNNTKLH